MARGDCRPAVMLLLAGLSTLASASAPRAGPPGASAPRSGHAPVATGRTAKATADKAGRVSVWVVLELPELASVARDQRAEREALRQKIRAQQDDVMSRLRDLGAIEQARVQLVRNALAVRLPVAQMDAARKIPGVRAVSRVHDIDRGPLAHGD